MNGIIKAAIVGGAAVFASEMAQGLDLFSDMPQVGKYGGAAAGALLAMKFV